MMTVNLERGMPTVEAARQRLEQAVRTARARRESVIKLIHGYGSSGKGGAIKRDAALTLSRLQREGKIQGYVPGEDFSPFNECARKILEASPGLSRDSDYARTNHGVTMVLVSAGKR